MYEPQTFDIPEIQGISKEQIEAHLALYRGYVKHVNAITETMEALGDLEHKDYVTKELWRRYGFEFNGMRNHEYYFKALEGGATSLNPESSLSKKIDEWGGFDELISVMKYMAGTRGSGWVMFVYDSHVGEFNFVWVDEHHLGMLSSVHILVALDCWEHAYMVDHDTTGRGTYVESYLNALNWSVVESWFDAIK